MSLLRYRGRHLKQRPVSRGPAAVGAATAVWMAGSHVAHAGTHVVRSGETLSGIAARYGTTIEALARANRLSDPNFIVTGQHITVPLAATMTSTHVVGGGETLSGIAARYGTTVRALARANHIGDPDFIVAGSTLKVPGGGSTSAGSAPSMSSTHVVRSGETLSGIAARYGTTVRALARANHLGNPGFIVAGSTLKVPGGGSTSARSTANLPSPAPLSVVQAALERHAANHNVDVSLVKAMAWQESGWQQHVVSEAGAIGVMQVMPGTARYVNAVLGTGNLDVRAADDNVHLGVRYLQHLIDTMSSERDAIAAYYAGPGNIGKKLTREQRHYVRAVQAHRPRFR